MTHPKIQTGYFLRRRRSTVGTVTETGAIVWNSGGKKLWISCWDGDFDTVKFYVDHGEKFKNYILPVISGQSGVSDFVTFLEVR